MQTPIHRTTPLWSARPKPLYRTATALLISAAFLIPRAFAEPNRRSSAPPPYTAKLSADLQSTLGGAIAPAQLKVWVFFTDKNFHNPGANDSAVAALATSYNPNAIRRRSLRGAARNKQAPIFRIRDLPLAQPYIDAVIAIGAKRAVKSRWLNAMSVRATPDQILQIAALDFVARIQPVRKATRIDPIEYRDANPAAQDQQTPVPQGAAFHGLATDQLAQINVVALHDQGYTGDGITIGILDTGFRRTHDAFNEPGHPLHVLAEYDFVNTDGNTAMESGDPGGQVNHGTWVLGVIGAYKPTQLVGAAYDADFVLCKTEDVSDEYQAEEDNFVAGLEFIESNGADVVTSSLGYIDWYTQADLDGLTAVTTVAVNIATSNGLICCNAAGNLGHDADPQSANLIAPADAFNVITCGAVGSSGTIAGFSSDGPTADGRVKPELLAPGVGVSSVSVSNDASYTSSLNGTSFSTPLIAGAVACILQAHPDWTVDQIRNNLIRTASDYLLTGTFDPDYVRGYGIIDAGAAATDCNSNAIADLRDIAGGTSFDCQTNGVPDECDPAGDFDADGQITGTDAASTIDCNTGPCVTPPCTPALYADPCCYPADYDKDGDVDMQDTAALQRQFNTFVP